MRTSSKIGLTNQLFLDRIKPQLFSWGLLQHPNPTASFGRNEHGYGYDFADTRNASDVKIAAFHIIRPEPSLWIKGYKTTMTETESDLPVIFDNMKNVFTLTRRWSILRPTNIRFEISKRRDESNEDAASRLIDAVEKELPKLRHYLYK